MKAYKLNTIDKLYFGYEEIARALNITLASAKVSASRYARQGLLLRVKRNIYVLREKWNAMTTEEKFILANLGQVPSYISFATALDYHEVTTQLQQGFIESAAVKRTGEIIISGDVFQYHKIKKDLYFGFSKQKDFFMASPEKALLDAVYLISFGRYALDFSAIDPRKLDPAKIEKMSRKYPLKTRNTLVKNGYLETT